MSGPQGPFPTVDALLAILPDPPAPDEWDPPLAEVLEKRVEIAQNRLLSHQGVVEKAIRYGQVWARLDEWRIQHLPPTVTFISPTLVNALGERLEETHETLDEWFARMGPGLARIFTNTANEELRMERDWFRLAEAGYRFLRRARALLAAIREITEGFDDNDPLPDEGVRLYRLLSIAIHDLDAVDTKLKERYDFKVWADDDERDLVRQIYARLARRLRSHVEWEHENRREERIRTRQSSRAAVPVEEAVDTLCVTCRTRQRHFGDYCKRCCPPDQRPHGKVI